MAEHREELPPELVEAALQPTSAGAYRFGPGDTVLVAVYNHPELSIANYARTGATGGRLSGLTVDNDGTMQLPLIGAVQAAGKTANELRLLVEAELSTYIQAPSVTVQLVDPGSIRYYLLG